MSVDPVSLNSAAVEALINAELASLAVQAATLRAAVQPGDVLSATVLPSNGLTDLLELLGNRVAASLPPTLRPGDVVQVQVSGFDGDQIILQLMDQPPDPEAGGAPPTLAGNVPAAPTPLGSAPPPTLAPAGTANLALGDLRLPTGLSPAVIVAAMVQPARDRAGAGPGSAMAGNEESTAPPPAIPPVARGVAFPVTATSPPTAIEARLAAARAGSIPGSANPGPQPASSAPTPAAPASSGGVPLRPLVIPPPIATSMRAAPPDDARPPVAAEAGAPANAAATAAPVRTIAAYRDPVVLVRALGLPVTPTSVAAAKLAIETPQRLPNALATLENALPNSDDPRVITLRAVAAFVDRIEPSSPQLAAQIEAYVEHVVDGGEGKLTTALAAADAAEQAATQSAAATSDPAEAGRSTAQSAAPSGAEAGARASVAPGAEIGTPAQPALPVSALAQAAVRASALLSDLKSQLFSLLSSPPPTRGDALTASATGALTAVTGVQLNTAAALAASPQTVAFSLPLWLGDGYTQAHIEVDRDAPQRSGVSLDGDNFHIAFILDTKHLGTVAIDLQAVGRAVNLSVKTEAVTTAERFGGALARLTDRLEKLRYRVASADATTAPVSVGTVSMPIGAPAVESTTPGELNLRA